MKYFNGLFSGAGEIILYTFSESTGSILADCNLKHTNKHKSTLQKMANLSLTSPNMSSIGDVCNRLGKTFLTLIVGNHWATGGLQVNSTPDYNLSFVPALGEYNIANHT